MITAEQFYNNDCRIEKIIHLKSMLATQEISDEFQEFVSDCDDGKLSEIFGMDMPEAPDEDDEEDYRDIREYCGEVADVLQMERKEGLLVCAATPVRKYSDNGNVFYSSWGHYVLKWFYTETLEDAELKAVEWAQELHNKAREKATAGGVK